MMARVSRLAGAICAATDVGCFLVGNTKEPCDFAAAGLAPPPSGEDTRYRRLSPIGPLRLPGPSLRMDLEGEALARLLADRLLIERNGSVSERLWRLALGSDHDRAEEVDARWLALVPASVWQIVRETVLRCS